MRADAQRNREKILAVADQVFVESGAKASLEEIAQRAKVGIGTLYRHFPTKEALLAAACDDRLLDLASRQDREAAPVPALRAFLSQLIKHASTYGGLAASLGVVLQAGSAGCHATTQIVQDLLARAIAESEVRRDTDFDDVVWMISAMAQALAQSPRDAHRIDHLLAVFMDGLRPRSPSKMPKKTGARKK